MFQFQQIKVSFDLGKLINGSSCRKGSIRTATRSFKNASRKSELLLEPSGLLLKPSKLLPEASGLQPTTSRSIRTATNYYQKHQDCNQLLPGASRLQPSTTRSIKTATNYYQKFQGFYQTHQDGCQKLHDGCFSFKLSLFEASLISKISDITYWKQGSWPRDRAFKL